MNIASQKQQLLISAYLNYLQVGDTVNRVFKGAGLVTDDDPVCVEKIDNFRGIFWITGSEGYYDSGSFYAYSLATGREINSVPGFVHQVIVPVLE